METGLERAKIMEFSNTLGGEGVRTFRLNYREGIRGSLPVIRIRPRGYHGIWSSRGLPHFSLWGLMKYVTRGCSCYSQCVCVCVCFWPPVSIPCPNYELVGFQPQAVDIPDLGSVHPPSTFSIPPTLKMHASDETIRTKDRLWAHGRPPVWASGCPNKLGTMYSDYSLSPTRYKRQWHETNDTNYNIQGRGRTIGGNLGTR